MVAAYRLKTITDITVSDEDKPKLRVLVIIIYMKKILDFDWLRTVQSFLNTVQK